MSDSNKNAAESKFGRLPSKSGDLFIYLNRYFNIGSQWGEEDYGAPGTLM